MTDLELFPTEKTIAPLCLCRHTLDRHPLNGPCLDCLAREWPCDGFEKFTQDGAA